MENKPIERTVFWDEVSASWRDRGTGVDLRDMPAPMRGDAGSAPSQPDFTPEQWGLIETRIEKVLTYRSVFHDHYFINDPSKLATYGYVRQVIGLLSGEINVLERQVAGLRCPWWKRWFNR